MRTLSALALSLLLSACGGGNESLATPANTAPTPVPCSQSAECTARVARGDHIPTCVETVAFGRVWSSWDGKDPVPGTCDQTAG